MSNRTELENHASTDIKYNLHPYHRKRSTFSLNYFLFRKRMSVVSIFNRIGLSKKFLGNHYDKVVAEINSKAEGIR